MRAQPPKRLQRRAEMTPAQVECYDLLSDFYFGDHHIPDRVVEWGYGIACELQGSELATFDFDGMTRLVFLAHDRCVRAAVFSRGMQTWLGLWKRDGREGNMAKRHPTIETALATWRRSHPAVDAPAVPS